MALKCDLYNSDCDWRDHAGACLCPDVHLRREQVPCILKGHNAIVTTCSRYRQREHPGQQKLPDPGPQHERSKHG